MVVQLSLGVIASVAKQSRVVFLDCFVPRSDAKRVRIGLQKYGFFIQP